MAFHTHQDGGPVCVHATKKACEEAYADWQAMQQVILAWRIASRSENLRPWRGGSVFDQLVLVIAGAQADITTAEGNVSQAPWVKRLRAALERAKAGDLPRYNLYRLQAAAETGGTDALH